MNVTMMCKLKTKGKLGTVIRCDVLQRADPGDIKCNVTRCRVDVEEPSYLKGFARCEAARTIVRQVAMTELRSRNVLNSAAAEGKELEESKATVEECGCGCRN